jgi:hypothetical protein
MKLTRIFCILSLITFIGATAFSVDAAVSGHKSNAYSVALVSLVAAAVAAAPKQSFSLGLQFSRTEETLLAYLQNSDQAIYEKYGKGQLRFRDYALYKALFIDGFSGIQKIWDSSTSKATGITNVDRAKLDKDVHVCVDRILIQYVNTGGAGVDPKAVTGYDGVVTSWPAGLANGELNIYQDGNPLLSGHPCTLCGSQADSVYAVGFADAYRLSTPFVLVGDKDFEVTIDFPASVAPSNTDAMRIFFLGVGTRKRGMI